MDASRSDVVASGASPERTQELLASAAALDYVLLMSVQHAAELRRDDAPAAVSVRETMTRAAHAALDVVTIMLRASDDASCNFAIESSLFSLLQDMVENDVLRSDDIAFRRLTLASEVSDRRSR